MGTYGRDHTRPRYRGRLASTISVMKSKCLRLRVRRGRCFTRAVAAYLLNKPGRSTQTCQVSARPQTGHPARIRNLTGLPQVIEKIRGGDQGIVCAKSVTPETGSAFSRSTDPATSQSRCRYPADSLLLPMSQLFNRFLQSTLVGRTNAIDVLYAITDGLIVFPHTQAQIFG